VRALVDSASLLWRCHVLGGPPQPVAIEEILKAVPDELLRAPGPRSSGCTPPSRWPPPVT
jgi:hypothetical protein